MITQLLAADCWESVLSAANGEVRRGISLGSRVGLASPNLEYPQLEWRERRSFPYRVWYSGVSLADDDDEDGILMSLEENTIA